MEGDCFMAGIAIFLSILFLGANIKCPWLQGWVGRLFLAENGDRSARPSNS